MSRKNNLQPEQLPPMSAQNYPPQFIIEMNEHHSNRMRARIFNLIDSSVSDPEQRKAFKGLIRDFTSEAHYALNRDIMDFLYFHKILDPRAGSGVSRLIDDPRVNPETTP